jgi:hypothetical protein
MTFDDAVKDFPAWAINERAPNVEYTPWHLLEHLRLTQLDMISYIRDGSDYKEIAWPADYWPAPDATTDEAGFQRTIDEFRADLAEFQAITADDGVDLTAVLEGTPGHTAARGISIIGNHNSYHVGEFAALRQVMGSWPPGHR